MTSAATRAWRVIDTGLRPAVENIALNRALLEARLAGAAPYTLRFLRFQPTALLGFHQSPEQELNLDYCRRHGIAVQRRITGGGAIYFDESQLGWELYLDRRVLGGADMAAIAARICEAAAAGIGAFGVDARFRPRNDIEVGGRKISGTGGAFDGDALLYQGTLLIDFDVARMLRVLRIPAEKLSDKAIQSARERVMNLSELLHPVPSLARIKDVLVDAFARAFEVRFESHDELLPEELERFRAALREMDDEAWVHQCDRPRDEAPLLTGIHRCPGGLMRAALALDRVRGVIKQVWITGDFFVNPRRLVPDLEAALKDTPVADLPARLNGFFDGYPVEMLMLGREDFLTVIHNALAADDVPGEESGQAAGGS